MAESTLVQAPVRSTAPLESSRLVEEESTVLRSSNLASLSAVNLLSSSLSRWMKRWCAGSMEAESFDFANLPAEIRNDVYRCILVQDTQPVRPIRTWYSPALNDLAILSTNRLIYSEAMPIFLSENTFIMTGSRKEHTWLRRMRPEGRSELRRVSLNVSSTACLHDASFYNALSLCSRVHLTLNVCPSRLVAVSLENKGSLRNMHGFAAATSDALPKETDVCAMHQTLVGIPAIKDETLDCMRSYELLLQQFRAPCVGKCRVHKGREGTHTQATIHISFQQACFYCC